MRYVASKYVIAYKEETYRIYVTDALHALGKFNYRWYDKIKPSVGSESSEDEEKRAEEIKSNISAKLGALGGKKNGLDDISGEIDT